MKKNPVLVLFCKKPGLGHGKQRLAADIGRFATLRVANALLNCALEDTQSWSGDLVISPSSSKEQVWAESLADQLPRKGLTRVYAQCDGNLGKRLSEIDTRLRSEGAEKILFMASDAPTLVASHFQQALLALDTFDVALGDDLDGGVTLMASRVPWPTLTDLPWSEQQLGDSLAELCQQNKLSVHRFCGGFDVDTLDDLYRLAEFLKTDPRPGRRALSMLIRDVVSIPA